MPGWALQRLLPDPELQKVRLMTNIIERAVARAAAKWGGIQATAKGQYGVFRRLSEEHREIASWLRSVATTSDVETRRELWPVLRDALLAHERAEMQEVYPDFEWHPSLVDNVVTHDEDAERLQDFVNELERLGFESHDWQPTVAKLEALMNAHIEREEELLFPHVQAVIGKDRAEELEARYVATKAAIQRIGP